MPRRGQSSGQILNKLRQVEDSVANGQTAGVSVREIGVTEQTFYRWRSEYRGLSLDQAKKLKRLEKENARLKRAVAELTLENAVQWIGMIGVIKELTPRTLTQSHQLPDVGRPGSLWRTS